MKLYVDYDGCLNNSIKQVCDLCFQDYERYVPWTDIFTWDFEELKLSKEVINAYFEDERMFQAINYMDNAYEVLNVLNTLGYEIIIVTMGTQRNLALKKKLLKQVLPFCKFKGVDSDKYKNKSHIDMSDGVFVDDCDSNLQTSNAMCKYCFGDEYPWNINTRFPRCNNWYDVLSKILKSKEKNNNDR